MSGFEHVCQAEKLAEDGANEGYDRVLIVFHVENGDDECAGEAYEGDENKKAGCEFEKKIESPSHFCSQGEFLFFLVDLLSKDCDEMDNPKQDSGESKGNRRRGLEPASVHA